MSVAAATLARRVTSSAIALAGRRIIVTLLAAAATAVVARRFGPAHYGQFSAALATWTLVLAASDFGFDLALGREFAKQPQRSRALLGAAYRLKGAWAFLLTLVLVALAYGAGLGSTRGQVLLVLAPSVFFSLFAPARQLFSALYRVHEAVVIDLVVVAAQVGAMVTLALIGGPVAVAAAISVGTSVNFVLVGLRARRLTSGESAERPDRRELLRAVLPLGVIGFLTKVYLMIDLVLLGWMVSGHALGDYAAASKILSLLVSLPGVVIASALPAFATLASAKEDLEQLTARIWHLLTVGVLPVLVCVAIFTRPLVEIVLGSAYDNAIPLVRILVLAATIGTASSVLGMLLVARAATRALVIQNVAAIVLNIGGNILLVPRYGVAAAAWLTVATELAVCCGAVVLLHGQLSFRPWLRVGFRPVVAVAAAASIALALATWPAIAFAASIVALVVLLSLLNAWPDELRGARRGWGAAR